MTRLRRRATGIRMVTSGPKACVSKKNDFLASQPNFMLWVTQKNRLKKMGKTIFTILPQNFVCLNHKKNTNVCVCVNLNYVVCNAVAEKDSGHFFVSNFL